jgi:hypothetical protein
VEDRRIMEETMRIHPDRRPARRRPLQPGAPRGSPASMERFSDVDRDPVN